MYRAALVCAVMLAVSSPLSGDCSASDKKALEEFDRAWSKVTQSGDRAALQQIYADDYMTIGPGGSQNKATSIDAAVRAAQNPDQGPPAIYDYYMITCTPVTATVTHRNSVTSADTGQTNYTRSVHVLEKRGGRWQVVSNAGYPLTDSGVILYLENEWNDAALKRDLNWHERNLARDFRRVSSRNGALRTKAEQIQMIREDKSTFDSSELSDTNVRVDGNTAVVNGVGRVRGREADGKPFDRRVRFTDVFIKRDGRWQVWSSQGTPISG